MKVQQKIDQIKKYIAKDEFELAIKELKYILRKDEKLDEVILQSSRFYELKKKERNGIEKSENLQVIKNNICKSLLEIVNEIQINNKQNLQLETGSEEEVTRTEISTKPIGFKNTGILANRDVNIKGSLVATGDIKIKTFIKNLISSRQLVLGTLLLITLLFCYPLRLDFYWGIKNKISTFKSQDNENLKILHLPFKADINYLEVEINFKDKIVERLKEKKSKENLPIEFLELQKIKNPTTNDEAIEIAKSKNADLVIWGNSQEDFLNGPKAIRLRYALTRDFKIDNSKKNGDTGMQPLRELEYLLYGYLQEDIDYVIHWIFSMAAYKNGDLKKSLRHLNKINTQDSTKIYSSDTHIRLGHINFNLERIDIALNNYQKALEIEKLNPDSINQTLALIYNNLGVYYNEQGNYSNSLEHHFSALKIRKKLFPINDGYIAQSYENIASVLCSMKKFDQAKNYVNKALSIRKQNHRNKLGIAYSIDILAFINNSLGQNSKALEYFLHSLELRKDTLNEDHHEIALSYSNIAATYNILGEYEKAIDLNLKTLKIRKKILPSNHRQLADIYNNIAVSYQYIGNFNKAKEFYFLALKIWQEVLPDDHFKLALCEYNIGILFSKLGDNQNAIDYMLSSKDIYLKNPISDKELAQLYNSIAIIYNGLKEYKYASSYIVDAINIQEKLNPIDSISLAISYHRATRINRNLGNYIESIRYGKKAVTLGEHLKFNSLSRFYVNLAKSYLKVSNLKAAKLLLKKAEKLKQFANLYQTWFIYYAIQKNSKLSIKYLKIALEFGFNDLEWLMKDKSLDFIRSKIDYQQILDSLK